MMEIIIIINYVTITCIKDGVGSCSPFYAYSCLTATSSRTSAQKDQSGHRPAVAAMASTPVASFVCVRRLDEPARVAFQQDMVSAPMGQCSIVTAPQRRQRYHRNRFQGLPLALLTQQLSSLPILQQLQAPSEPMAQTLLIFQFVVLSNRIPSSLYDGNYLLCNYNMH